jgi:hypothetical protein
MASKARRRAVTGITQSKPATVPAGRPRLWIWLFAAGLIIAGAVYSPAFNGPFIFDDLGLPFSNPNADKMPLMFWFGGVRPVLMASYWLNYQVSGIGVSSYHAFNLVLHAATAVVVFFVLQRLIHLAGIKGKTFLISLFGAGLFLLHPLQSESVAYIAGRSELVSGLFLLSAWLVFLNHFDSKTTLTTTLKILLLATAAALGKESAISLPAVLFITDWYWSRARLQDQIRDRLNLYVPMVFAGALAAITIVHSIGKGSGAGQSVTGVTPFQYALTQCRVILIYLRLFLIPIGQNGDWQIPFYRSLADHDAWLYVFGMLFLLGVIVVSYRRSPLLSFGLAVFLALLMPTSSVVPIQDALAERRMYVPIIGLILASVAIVQRFQLESAILRTGAMGVLVLAAILTFQRSRVWGDDIVFWKDIIRENPANRRAHIGLGESYALNGKFADAIAEYDAIDKLDGVTEETILNRVAAYKMMRNFDLALDGLQRVAAMHPTPATYGEIGELDAYIGHAKESLAAFTLALTLDPKYAPAYAQRGMVYLSTGDADRAKADFKSALAIEPNNDIAMAGLSRLAGAP